MERRLDDESRRQLLMQWLRELRDRYGSDAEIARRSGLDKTRISRWRRGELEKGGITLKNLVLLAKVSDHTLGDMLMAFYGVPAEELRVTIPVAEVTTVAAFPDRVAHRMVRLPEARYRLLLLLLREPEPD